MAATTTKTRQVSKFVKKAVRAGVYKQTSLDPVTDKIVTQTVYVSPQFLRKSAFSTMHMMQSGRLQVPVCLDHQEGAIPKPAKVDDWLANEMRNSVGLLEEVIYNPETQEHEYKFSVNDPVIAEKIKSGIITAVSPNFHNEFSPGSGGRYTNVIAHLALTFRPRDFNQSREPIQEVSAVRASTPDKTGSVRFSVMKAATNTGEFLVPMHQMSFNTLKAMAKRDSTGRVSFESVDYTFKFETLGDFNKWLTRRYQWTLQMSVAGRFGHVLYFAVVHAPVGGITIGGRRYLGGQFIPTTSLESLHPEDRKRVQDASAALRQKRTEAASAHRGADETWHQAIKRHVGEHANRELSTSDRQQAIRRLNALRNHHGDQVAERIAMLAGQDAAKLAGAADGPDAELLKRRLAAYHAMSGMLGDKDLPKPQEMKQAASEGKGPQTGQPYEFNYAHNTQKSGKFGKQFGQDIEPHGRYLVDREGIEGGDTPGWEYGKHKLENPLVVDFGGGYQEDSNWKKQLSKQYGGATGKKLSQAIRDAGHDGIITKDKHGTSEIVDLTSFKPSGKSGGSSIPLTSEQSINQLIDKQAKQAKGMIASGMTADQAIEKLKEDSTLGPASWEKVRAQLPSQDDSGHKNALSEMSDAAGDVDAAIKKRMHNEMKQELMDRMKEDWPHLSDEQKAEFEKKIAALPHNALGDPDEHGVFPDTPNEHRAANDIISDVNDAAYDAKRENENKAAKEKRITEHKKDIEEAAKRGLVFERPDDHENPGDLKVHPEKLDLAKAAAKEYKDKAKQHLEDSKNQLNKKEATRSRRMHKHMSEAAKEIQQQIDAHEKAKAPALVTSANEHTDKVMKDKPSKKGLLDSIVDENQKHAKMGNEDRASADALSKPFDAAAVVGSGSAAPHHKEMLADLDREWHRNSVKALEMADGDGIKWGGADFEHKNKGIIGKTFADAIRAGKSPMEAHQIALDAGKKSVKQWNDVDSKGRASAAGNYQLKNWEGMGSDYADSLMRKFHQATPEYKEKMAAESKAKDIESAPMDDGNASKSVASAIPELEHHSGSWMVTRPSDGKVVEVHKQDRDKLEKALARFPEYKVETAATYLANLNAKRKDDASTQEQKTLSPLEKVKLHSTRSAGGPIKSDSPSAVSDLQAKHDAVKRSNDRAKKVNALIRQYATVDRAAKAVNFKPGKTKDSLIAEMGKLGIDAGTAHKLITPDFVGRVGYPSYHFSSNNQEMARLKKRMTDVSAEQQKQSQGDVEHSYSGGVSVHEDTGANRIKISFPGKPERVVIEKLKRAGWRWSPTNSAWQRHLNNAGRYSAKELLNALGIQKEEQNATVQG